MGSIIPMLKSQDYFTSAGTEIWGEMKCIKVKDRSVWARHGETSQFGYTESKLTRPLNKSCR